MTEPRTPLEQLLFAGARLGAKALAAGLDSALEEIDRAAKRGAREVGTRIARARQRLENVVPAVCEHCGWRHDAGQCGLSPCEDCGEVHDGGMCGMGSSRRRSRP